MRSEPKFGSVSLRRQTTITGGLLKKPMAIPVMEVKVGDVTREFAHIAKGQDWLCKAVTGEHPSKRPLSRVKLVDTLSKHVFDAASGGADAVSCGTDLDATQEDPMSALELSLGEGIAARPNAPKQKTCRKTPWKNTVAYITVPEKCKERFPESTSTRDVALWIKDKREIWLQVEHIPWAIQYMHDQFRLGGVAVLSDAVASPGSSSAPSSASDSPSSSKSDTGTPRVWWEFGSDEWMAISPRPNGNQKRALKPSDVNLSEASKVMDNVDSLDGVPYSQMKDIAFKILEKWAYE